MDQINEIKQKLDIVDVVGGYVTLKKSGRNYKGLCPFHAEDTPSFMVSQELQIFKCFGCQSAGDIFKFIQEIEGVDFSQALQTLAEKAGVKLQKHDFNSKIDAQKKIIYEINHLTSEYYHYLLTKHAVGKIGLDYVKKQRQLSDITIRDFTIGYAPDNWDTLYKALIKKGYKPEDLVASGVVIPRSSGQGFIDKFRGRIIFPLTAIDGKIVGFTGRTIFNKDPKYLNTGETLVFQKSNILYALDKAKVAIKKEGCVVVEGQMDVISAHQAGITNVIAFSGTAVTGNQLKILSRYTKDITFCFDSDSAGESASRRAFELAEKEGFNINVVTIPKGYKDLDELIKHDVSEAKSVLANPIPAYDFILNTIIKKYDKTSATGKKKIMEELVYEFSRMTNQVLLDHYIKKIAEALDISESVVSELLTKKVTVSKYLPEEKPALAGSNLPKKSAEDYALALLLKAPLDSQISLLYKLEAHDFTNPEFQAIYTSLKSHHDKADTFNVQAFIDTIDSNLKNLVSELYLWDLGDLFDEPKLFLQEINATFARIRRDTLKRELKNLTLQIKQAEAEGNTKLLKELSNKFKDSQKSYAETS